MELTRRQTLGSFCAVAAAASMTHTIADAAKRKKTTMRPLGIQLYMLSKELETDFQGTLNQVAAIGYREVRDGAGKALPIVDPGVTIKDVATDGKQAAISFTVASVAGRRVIFPIPNSSALRFNAISVGGGWTTSCLQSSGSENGRLHYFTCTIDPSGQVRYSGGSWAPESIRLELAG